MKQINLYQAEFRPPKILLPARALVLSGVVFWAGLLALYGWQSWQLKQVQTQVDAVVKRADAMTRQVAASQPGARTPNLNLVQEAQTLETRVRALQLAQDAIANGELGSETGFSAQFRALARTTAPGAWLTGVTILDAGRGLTLQGRALTSADAARLIANLRQQALFVGLSFAGLEVRPPESPAASARTPNKPAEQTNAAPRFLVFSLNARLSEAVAVSAAPLPRSGP
jgi:Tfp pilus assembly protein PilN